MARRHSMIVTLIVVLLTPLLVNTPYIPTTVNAAPSNESPVVSPPPPYGGPTLIGEYWGSGGVTQVHARYNKTMSTKTETTDTADLQFQVPSNWQSSVNITLEDITADSPVNLDIETNDTAVDGNIFFSSGPYMSFQVTNSCYLHSLQIYINLITDDVGADARVWIYNATNSAGTPRPDSAITGTISVELGPFGLAWKNHTFASLIFLNTSETYANTFFVKFLNENTGVSTWYMRSDVLSPPDNGYIWYSSPLQQWAGNDLMMNVSLRPLGRFPTPQQISLQINGSAVNDFGSNSGWWTRSFIESGSSAFFDITASWPITLNYTYFAEFNQTFLGSTTFHADYQIAFTDWNISTAISYPNVGADANSRTINFTLPAYWSMLLLYNGSTSILGYQVQDNSPTPGWVYLDEPNGAGNGTLWRVESTDANRIQAPTIWHDEVDVTGTEVNITDTIHVEAQVLTFVDGEGRFTPYDKTGASPPEESLSPDLSGLLNFTEFAPITHTSNNGTLRCEVVWNNSYYVGIGLSTINLVYPTAVVGVPASYTSLIGDSVNISVYYWDTYNTLGIPKAEVNVTFNGIPFDLTDRGGGYYWDLVDTGAMGLSRGVHAGLISADRSGYIQATSTVALTLWSKTQLVANWTSLTISYTESVTLEVNYSVLTPLGEGGIVGAELNISDSFGFFMGFSEVANGNYTVLLDGTVLDVGTHNLVVNASKPGERYQNNTLLVTITVIGEATTATGSAPSTVDGGATFNVSITYEKQSDGTGITGASISCLLDDTPFTGFILFDLLNGTYRAEFVLNVSGSPATFNITLIASRSGFEPASYTALVDVLIRPTTYSVQVLSTSPVVYNAPFQIRVTYQDLFAVGIIGAVVDGNWSTIISLDNFDGTYTVTCQTAGWTAGWWTISFNITVDNYQTQYFNETFYLVWDTTLTPQGGNYSPTDYENETITLEVIFWDSSNGVGIVGASVWTVFQSVTHNFVFMGSGVYQLTLNLTGVTPATYPLIVYAQRPNYENQSITLNLGVLAKHAPSLIVILPPDIVEGTEVAVRVDLAFANATPIIGAPINLTVWVHYQNGTNVVLYSGIVTTDDLGTRIVTIQLDTYSESEWANGNFDPYLWASAEFGGTRALAASTDVASESISPRFNPWPWWVYLLVNLLPFIIILIFIIIISWAYYAKRVKPRRLAQQEALEQSAGAWAQRMMGLMNLRALFVTYSKTGLPIFTYDFAGGEMPSTLLSGFLSAVNAFYSELSGELDRESQLRDIHYKDLHLSLREGKYIVSVIILDSSPSEVLTQSLAEFTSNFEVRFRKDLATFDGRIDVFDKATEIVESSFHGELLLAYECVKAPSRGFARKIYELGVNLANDEGRIYLPQLFVAAIEKYGSKKKFDIANALEQLHEQGCFVPSNTNTTAPPEKSDNPSDSAIFF